MSERPPIGESPEPEYPRRVGDDTPPPRAKPRHQLDTGEWNIEDVVHELKERRVRRTKEILAGIAGIIVALGTATASVVQVLKSSDREDGHDTRIEKIEKHWNRCCNPDDVDDQKD